MHPISRASLTSSLALAVAILGAGCSTDGPTAPQLPVSAAKGGPKAPPSNGRIYYAADLDRG